MIQMMRRAALLVALGCVACQFNREEEPLQSRLVDSIAPSGTPAPVTILSPVEQRFAADRAAGIILRAIGAEPGWFLTIDQTHRMVFQTNAMDDSVVAVASVAPADPNAAPATYMASVGKRILRVDMVDSTCSDAVGDQPFDRKVTVVWGDSTYTGCGKRLR